MRTVYSGSKFALTGFSKALRSEVKPHGIQVSMIYPGYVQTNISQNACTGVHGEKLGATDANIANGIPADKAV